MRPRRGGSRRRRCRRCPQPRRRASPQPPSAPDRRRSRRFGRPHADGGQVDRVHPGRQEGEVVVRVGDADQLGERAAPLAVDRQTVLGVPVQQAACGMSDPALRAPPARDVPGHSDDVADGELRALRPDLHHRADALVSERERPERRERCLVGDDVMVQVAGGGRQRAHQRIGGVDQPRRVDLVEAQLPRGDGLQRTHGFPPRSLGTGFSPRPRRGRSNRRSRRSPDGPGRPGRRTG